VPAKRQRDSAKHQEKAQTEWFLRRQIILTARLLARLAGPLHQKEGICGCACSVF
jgi:hypothetical protein